LTSPSRLQTFAATASTFPIAIGMLKTVVNEWAAPLGLKVLLDMHTAVGSQNGFDNSGRRGPINLLSQPDGSPDTENMRRWLQSVTELSSWAVRELDASALWGIEVMNEPFGAWGKMWDAIQGVINPSGYKAVRSSSPEVNVIFQTGFIPLAQQEDYTEPAYHNVFFDDHRYQCFGGSYNALTYNISSRQPGWDKHIQDSCVKNPLNTAKDWSFVGEWSLAVTDCAKYLAGGINGGFDGAFVGNREQGDLPNSQTAHTVR
jgi:glucan 1,3-beta-glucosidase